MPSFSAKDLREALHDLDSLDPKTDFTTVANSEGLQATLSASIYPITRCDCKIGKLNNGGQGRVTRATAAARMHPRNVFADTSTDFFVLGKRQPCFRPFVEQSSVSRWHVNFKSWEVTRALNRSLPHVINAHYSFHSLFSCSIKRCLPIDKYFWKKLLM